MLQKMVAQRRDSIEMYQKGNRADLVQQETEEIAVIQRYMPQGLTRRRWRKPWPLRVAAVGATSVKDMGKVMAALKEQLCRPDGLRQGRRPGETEAGLSPIRARTGPRGIICRRCRPQPVIAAIG